MVGEGLDRKKVRGEPCRQGKQPAHWQLLGEQEGGVYLDRTHVHLLLQMNVSLVCGFGHVLPHLSKHLSGALTIQITNQGSGLFFSGLQELTLPPLSQ